MAGTNRTNETLTGGPVVILVAPQLGENIGMAARAMLNCGLTELRLVSPRQAFPNERAVAAASGADLVLDGAEVFGTVEDAIADLNMVYAATARRRHFLKEIVTPARAAAEMRAAPAEGRAGVLFGPENSGLDNDHVALADRIVEAPLNPAFSSLNLSQAVLIIGWEWMKSGREDVGAEMPMGHTYPAEKELILKLFEHLEDELDARGFLVPVEKRPSMVRNIRNIFHRMALTDQEVRTLRGVISSLTRYPRQDGK